jgi:hypothetical protein
MVVNGLWCRRPARPFPTINIRSPTFKSVHPYIYTFFCHVIFRILPLKVFYKFKSFMTAKADHSWLSYNGTIQRRYRITNTKLTTPGTGSSRQCLVTERTARFRRVSTEAPLQANSPYSLIYLRVCVCVCVYVCVLHVVYICIYSTYVRHHMLNSKLCKILITPDQDET